MRRAACCIASGLLLACLALAQEGNAGGAAEAGDPWLFWKWINFAILVVGLGYLIGKAAPAYFQARRDEIQKALTEAAREIKDAETKAADLDLRLSGIQAEAEQMRQEAQAMMAAEAGRIREETQRHLTRIQEQTTQEIVLLSRVARDELRKYSAGLALDLAEQRIRVRVNAEVESGLVDSFLSDLRGRARAN